MPIHILYFGMLAECTGQHMEIWDLDEKITVQELTQALLEKYPVLRDRKFRVAVNQQLADTQTPVLPGAEVALLPPFAGG
jgi:molybdopterin synthase sulfur carrier subunit